MYVEGRLQTRSYDDKDGKVYTTEVVADEVILLGGKEDGDASGGLRWKKDQPHLTPVTMSSVLVKI